MCFFSSLISLDLASFSVVICLINWPISAMVFAVEVLYLLKSSRACFCLVRSAFSTALDASFIFSTSLILACSSVSFLSTTSLCCAISSLALVVLAWHASLNVSFIFSISLSFACTSASISSLVLVALA